MKRSTAFFALVLLGPLVCSASDALVTAKDRTIASKANAQTAQLCQGMEPIEIPENAKERLLSASGDNFALNALREAKDMKEFEENLKSNIDGGFIAKRAGPLAACFLFLLAYTMCCWTACPCCRKCRVLSRHHRPKRLFKIIAGVVIAAILLGTFVAAAVSRRGFQRATDGFKGTSCTGARLMNTTLSGSTDPYFMGMIGSLTVLDGLVDNLQENSPFITDLSRVIDNTKPIEHAVTLASGTLMLLKDMVALDANVRPKKSGGEDLLHHCELCPNLEQALTPAISALAGGVAAKLKEARGEVKDQLSGQALTDLRSTVTEATGPLKEMKGLFVENFGWLVDSTTLQDFTEQLDRGGLAACMVMVLLCALLGACSCSTMGCWTCREFRTKGDESSGYRPGVHRCALTTWCCGCWYMILALLIGGMMVLLTVPMASACLILDDISGQMLEDISQPLKINITGDQGAMMKNTIDQCFRNANTTGNPNLLDIIYSRNKTTNEKITMRQTVVDNTKNMINGKFDEIASSMSASGMSLATDPNIVTLKDILTKTKVSTTMRIPQSYNFASTPYAAMDSTSLAPYWFSSGACEDAQIAGATSQGLINFSKTLAKDYGVTANPTIIAPACAQQVVCKPSAGAPCTAGNQLMKLKQDLRSTTTMKCRLFKTASGTRCDVKDMTKQPSGAYANDCLQADGTLQTDEYSCTLEEFTELVQGFALRIDKVMARLDSAASSTMSGINVDMKGLVDRDVIGSITQFADGVSCAFLGVAYQGFIESTCYSGVVGFSDISYSYVACGVLTLLLNIIMYIVWRIAVDNYNHNSEPQTGPAALSSA